MTLYLGIDGGGTGCRAARGRGRRRRAGPRARAARRTCSPTPRARGRACSPPPTAALADAGVAARARRPGRRRWASPAPTSRRAPAAFAAGAALRAGAGGQRRADLGARRARGRGRGDGGARHRFGLRGAARPARCGSSAAGASCSAITPAAPGSGATCCEAALLAHDGLGPSSPLLRRGGRRGRRPRGAGRLGADRAAGGVRALRAAADRGGGERRRAGRGDPGARRPRRRGGGRPADGGPGRRRCVFSAVSARCSRRGWPGATAR